MEDKNYKTTIKRSIEHIDKLVRITNKDKHLTTESKLMVTMGLLGLQGVLANTLEDLENR